jgi:5-methyltetrahydropteroyltriglutamate--homocysteine methyltransferase
MVLSANLGFPRIGPKRELKKAVESYWKGESNVEALLTQAAQIRKNNWEMQKKQGVNQIPSNDFSLYDQVLDTIALFGAVPERYGFKSGNVDLSTYFAMARGAQTGGIDVGAMEMTKWFDTNYHYIVPEFHRNQTFALSSTKIFDEFNEAKSLGITTKPVLLGPVTFLKIGKKKEEGYCRFELLSKLLPVYDEILGRLSQLGAKTVQIDEPALVLDLGDGAKDAYKTAYKHIGETAKDLGIELVLATYFGDLRDNLELAVNLPVSVLHVDLVRGANQLSDVLAKAPKGLVLSLGVVDGRNIWRNDFDASLALINQAIKARGKENIIVAPSCSLLHSPVDLSIETGLDEELKGWMAFATQKVEEIVTLAKIAGEGEGAAKEALEANRKAAASRKTSSRIHNPAVKSRAASVTPEMKTRKSPFAARAAAQSKSIQLPLLPTTTIGSFPQTQEVRQARAKHKSGELSDAQYNEFLQQKTEDCIRSQEQMDIDVLVHGEFERNDMVEYFGEQLKGFAFSGFGWVQSYGSRCVKPPVIFGDVSREAPMTVEWAKFSQSKTSRIMKGMLTGPVTILQWSFVRNDQPRSETCRQIALAIRDEVVDLEKAGIKIIQIDEAAVREGLPVRKADWQAYLDWAVEAFRITASGVKDETQIHTHMCYSEFNDIIKAVADMDADVISIETSRSQMELLDAFVDFKYPNDIGPGVYDIHSPRIPSEKEMTDLLHKALEVLKPEQVWVNPDCGLKTRGWKEVKPALESMVASAKKVRAELASQGVTARKVC